MHAQSIEYSSEIIGANKTRGSRASIRIEARLFLFLLSVMKMELIKEVIAQTNINWTEQHSLQGNSQKVQSPQKHMKQDHLSRKHLDIEPTLLTIAHRMMNSITEKCQKTISKTDIKESDVRGFPDNGQTTEIAASLDPQCEPNKEDI